MSLPLITLPPASPLDRVLQPVDAMVDEVASLVGMSTDPEGRQKALTCLDRAADEMNMVGLYLYQRREQVYSVLTDDQDTLDLPPDWGWPTDWARLYDPTGQWISEIEWVPWDRFILIKRDNPPIPAQRSGRPAWASIRSDSDNVIYLHPPLDTSLVASITVPYFTRVQRPSEVTDLLVTPEQRECLIRGGEALMTRYRFSNNPAAWMPFWNQFQTTLLKAKAASNRAPGQHAWARPRV